MLEFGSSVPDLVPAFRQFEVPALDLCSAADPYPDKPEVPAGSSCCAGFSVMLLGSSAMARNVDPRLRESCDITPASAGTPARRR